jgi:hypothetical protein
MPIAVMETGLVAQVPATASIFIVTAVKRPLHSKPRKVNASITSLQGARRSPYAGHFTRRRHSTICHNLLMCGRYRLSRRKQIIEEHFDTVSGEDDWTPRYNIAPTQPVPIVRQNPKEPRRELSLVRWGLIPLWSSDMSGAAMMINARSETSATKPAFRDPLVNRRCLVPADGFYEWQRRGNAKQPFCFEVNEGKLFAFLRMSERCRADEGECCENRSVHESAPRV